MNNIHLAEHHGVLLETLLKIFKAHFLSSNHDFIVKWQCSGARGGGGGITINSIRKFLYMDPYSVAREHGFFTFENLEAQDSYLFHIIKIFLIIKIYFILQRAALNELLINCGKARKPMT